MSEEAQPNRSGIYELADLILEADQEYARTPANHGGPVYGWASLERRRREAIASAILMSDFLGGRQGREGR